MAKVVREIELRPHVGYTMHGTRTVFNQDQVFLNGVRVGYVGHGPGDGLALIRPADKETIEAIVAKIEEVRGQRPASIGAAKPIEDRPLEGSDDE